VFEVETVGGDAARLKDLALDFQRRCGSEVQFGLAVPMPDGHQRAVFEFEEEALAQAALQLALDVIHDGTLDPTPRLVQLRELAHEVCLGPSTRAIVRAARERGIPMRRLGSGSLVVLGHAARQRRVCTAETDATSAIAETIAQDKELTRGLLRAVGVPVPEGRPVESAEDAWKAAEELGLPVVVKPQYGNHGRGVATNLSTRAQIERAYAAAREEGSSILAEQHIQGDDYRLLVIGGRLIAAALREPAHVVGDGRSTIAQLVEEANKDPRRSDGHSTSLSFIKLDPVGLAVLAEQGYTPASIPPAGQRVLIRRNGNLSTGGTATDVTDRVHPDVASRAVAAARVIGLDIAGVDLVATDVSRPLEEQRAAVVEVNAGPGLRMHLEPSAGKPRPVGQVIVDMLFPPGETGRIPIVAVAGVNGKTTTSRLLAHLFRSAGHTVGLTCTDGMYVDGQRLDSRDCSGPRSARAVLLNPAVTAAVLETARGGIVREGLGFGCCDAAIVTNIGQGDHLGLRGIETLEDLARVKRVVVEAVAPAGTVVLNADDPLVRDMARHCPGKILFFARAEPRREQGQRAAFTRNSNVVLARGSEEIELLPLERVPMTHEGKAGFQVENVLAAAGAAWSVGLPLEAIRAGLESFACDARQAPGRFNVMHKNGATVIVDYAHNASALQALVSALDGFPHRRRTLVFAGCNRRDEDVIALGRIVGHGFDRVVLYRDQGNRGRIDGELQELLLRGLAAGPRLKERLEAASEQSAIETALNDLRADDLLVVGAEAIEETLALVEARLT
jgi:cyanophycin synthetase